MTISHYLTNEHKECDNLFVIAEESVNEGAWDKASQEWNAFQKMTLAHFMKEEEILFPLFEEKTGMSCGPTEVMRMEHTQIRGIIEQMNYSMQEHNSERFLGLCETFMMLLQQHNMKEEQILYTMSDRALSHECTEIVSKMQEVA